MRIDAHQHFWRYDPDEYPWISAEMKSLMVDFLPEQLEGEMTAAAVDASIAVQARQSVVETHWLLDIARRYPFIRGVVGWLPLADPEIERITGTFAEEPALVGVRHYLQNESADLFEDVEFNRGLDVLSNAGLVYDLLVSAHQLSAAIELVDRHPNQIFVLDHCAKPLIANGKLAEWAADLRRLAERPNCRCKLSGLVTEACWDTWKLSDLRPYMDTALKCFGADRLMFGSDWPVCTVASSYSRWVSAVKEYTDLLSESERQAIWRRTAIRVYRLERVIRPANDHPS